MEIEETQTVETIPPVSIPEINSITLSDGRVVIIRDAIGSDQIKAVKLISGDQSKYLFALLQLCATIDGQVLFIEDYEAMKLKDTQALSAAFSAQNF